MTLGLNQGEILLVAFIFALVYGAGLLPKLVARLTSENKASEKKASENETSENKT